MHTLFLLKNTTQQFDSQQLFVGDPQCPRPILFIKKIFMEPNMPIINSRYRSMSGAIFVFMVGVMFTASVNAMSINFRAQGHYYSAKEAFEGEDYNKSLHYVYQSKKALKGSNRELQYLHILSAYNIGNFSEAQTQLQLFFDLEEKRTKPINFDKSVDRLTNDEIRALLMIMNKIDEGHAKQLSQEKLKQKHDAMMVHIDHINSVFAANNGISFETRKVGCGGKEFWRYDEYRYTYGPRTFVLDKNGMKATLKYLEAGQGRTKVGCRKWTNGVPMRLELSRDIDFGTLRNIEWREIDTPLNYNGHFMDPNEKPEFVQKTPGFGRLILKDESGEFWIPLASSRIESVDSLIKAFYEARKRSNDS